MSEATAILQALTVMFGSHVMRGVHRDDIREALAGPLAVDGRDAVRTLLNIAHTETMVRGWPEWRCYEAHPVEPCSPEKFWHLRAVDLALPHSCLVVCLDGKWVAVERITSTRVVLRDDETPSLPLEGIAKPSACWVLRRSL